jgi:hypothetical protein
VTYPLPVVQRWTDESSARSECECGFVVKQIGRSIWGYLVQIESSLRRSKKKKTHKECKAIIETSLCFYIARFL